MSRKLPIYLFFSVFTFLSGEVGKFLEPISFGKQSAYSETKHFLKSSALIAPTSNLGYKDIQLSSISKVELDRPLLEKKLSEMLAHRYQSSGKISAYLTREWKVIEIGPNFIVKINDCMPDELCPSTFVRFSIWDRGSFVGNFAEPVRLAHYVDVFFSTQQMNRGSRLSSSMFSLSLIHI